MEQIYLTIVIGISFLDICLIVLQVDNFATISDAILRSVAWSVVMSVYYFIIFTIAMEMAKSTTIGDKKGVKKLEKKRFWFVLGFSLVKASGVFAFKSVRPGWNLGCGNVIMNIIPMLASFCALWVVEKQYSVVAEMLSFSTVNKNATSAKETVSDDPKIQALQRLRKRIKSFRTLCFVIVLVIIYNIANDAKFSFKYYRIAQPCESELFSVTGIVGNLATIIFLVGFPLKRFGVTKVAPAVEKKNSFAGWSSEDKKNAPEESGEVEDREASDGKQEQRCNVVNRSCYYGGD